MTKYRLTGGISLDDNPLDWWKANENIYKHVSKLAKRYLSISATSVPSERVFSTAGDILTANRSVFSPENVDKLIFLAKNLTVD